MKFLSRIVGIVLFILFFGFALKNTHEVALHFFLGYEIRAPLVLMGRARGRRRAGLERPRPPQPDVY